MIFNKVNYIEMEPALDRATRLHLTLREGDEDNRAYT